MKNPLAIIGVVIALSELGFATSYEDPSYLSPPSHQTNSCIHCESYVPLYQPVAGCDTFVSIEALYWFARERTFYYAIQGTQLPIGELLGYPTAQSSTPLFTILNQRGKSLGTTWSPGVRAEIGWGSDCNDWDLELNWTYFHNQKTKSCSVPSFGFLQEGVDEFEVFPGPEQSAIFNPWANQAPLVVLLDPAVANLGGTPAVYFQYVKANWRLTLNDISLSIGRTFSMRNGLTFRPYAGMRGAWTKTQFQTKSLLQRNVTFPGITQRYVNLILRDRFIDRFWGVGVHLGIEPSWYFCSSWSIFGNFDAALIYGTARSKKKEYYRDRGSETILHGALFTAFFENYNRVAFKSSYSSMQPIFDLTLGLRFDQSFCSGRYHSEIDLAWEHHLWLENNSRMQTADGELQEFQAGADPFSNLFVEGVSPRAQLVSSTLNYGGPILRVRFDF